MAEVLKSLPPGCDVNFELDLRNVEGVNRESYLLFLGLGLAFRGVDDLEMEQVEERDGIYHVYSTPEISWRLN